jgi:hypothetical protein
LFKSCAEREQRAQALCPDEICLRQVHGHGSLTKMKNNHNKTFWDFSVQLTNLKVEDSLDCLTPNAVEPSVEFRNYSSAVGYATSGLRTDMPTLLPHLDDLAEQLTGSYALPPEISWENNLLQRPANVVTAHRQPLVFQHILSRTLVKSPLK